VPHGPLGPQWDTLNTRAKRLSRHSSNQKLDKKTFIRVRGLWDMYDVNENGEVDQKEFMNAVRRMNPTMEPFAKDMFSSFDHDKDGVLSFVEFFRMECPWAKKREIEACIDKYGAKVEREQEDDNTKMSEEEIADMWECLAVQDVVTFDQLLQICPEFDLEYVRAGDTDGDGSLDRDEFFALLRYAK